MIKLHIFDMDNTLIENDCDVSWKEFLVAEKIAPESALLEAEKFFAQYNSGSLDTEEFARFQLAEFAGRTIAEMQKLCQKHFEKVVLPTIRPAAAEHIRKLHSDGAVCAILTSTNHYIAEPLAKYLGISELHGSPLETADGKFTGRPAGKLYVKEVKAQILDMLCGKYGIPREETAAYGDSINDAEMLAAAGHPFAVSPSEALKKLAKKNNWTILDWNT